MSFGKYSPNLPNRYKGWYFFDRNAKGEVPPLYDPNKDVYSEEIHFGNYDPNGFDSYGYSAYDKDGNFVGTGNGIDRNGYTEHDYLTKAIKDFQNE